MVRKPRASAGCSTARQVFTPLHLFTSLNETVRKITVIANIYHNNCCSCAGRTVVPAWDSTGPAQPAPEQTTVTELAQFDNPHIIYVCYYIFHCVAIKSLAKKNL